MSVKKMKIKELPIMVSDGNYSAKYPKSSEFVESGIPFIRANNIKDNKVIWNDIIYISKEKHSTLLKGHLKKNDVLFTVRGILGHVGIVGEDFENANINAQIALLRADDKYINPKYLMYSLNTNDVKSQIERNQTGTTLKQLPISRLKELVIVMREKSKQDKIVKCLDKSYELIINRKEQIKELDLLVKSKFIEMFGDPVKNNKNFKIKKIKDISIYLKRGVSPKYVDESGIKVINQKCVYWNELKRENCKYYNEDYRNKVEKIFLQQNDVLINSTGTGTLGRAMYFNANDKFDYIADSHITILRLDKEHINHIFISNLFEFNNIQDNIYKKCVNGSTNQIELSVSKLGEYLIIVPPIELQNQFADFVKQVDKLKFEMENSLKKLEDNFNSLMQKSFNGELV